MFYTMIWIEGEPLKFAGPYASVRDARTAMCKESYGQSMYEWNIIQFDPKGYVGPVEVMYSGKED